MLGWRREKRKNMHIAVVLASGSGWRMGAKKNKVLLRLGGRPVASFCITAFQENRQIEQIIITARKTEQAEFRRMVERYKFTKVSAVIEGGEKRQDSVSNALEYIAQNKLADKGTVVIIHNGANPFVSQEDISGSIRLARKHGACVVAHRIKDTIKEADERGFVRKTLERKTLWGAQTPQAIRFALARQAFRRAEQENFRGTDDVSLVERLGRKVKILESSPDNFKLTTPIDRELARVIVKRKNVRK